MRLNTLFSFAGFVILIAALYCPILRPFHLYNIDAFGANKPYGMVLLLIAVVGVIGTVFNQAQIIRMASLSSLGLVILFYLLAFLKIHTSFSFIPFHSIDAFLTRQIKFKWGWYLLFGGPLLALAGIIFGKRTNFNYIHTQPAKTK
jgi:hypothetical protein